MMRSTDSAMLVVDVATDPQLRLGEPRLLFEGRFWSTWDSGPGYAVAPGGSRLLMAVKAAEPKESSELVVVQNWFDQVERMFERSSAAGGRP